MGKQYMNYELFPLDGIPNYSDEEAEKLHDRTVYDMMKAAGGDLEEAVVWALLESLDEDDLRQMREAVTDERVRWRTRQIEVWRRQARREAASEDPVNLNAHRLLKDYSERRKGRIVEARKQLRHRFDGLDHDLQTEVARAFLLSPCRTDRDYMYRRLSSGVFWDESLLEVIKTLWETTHETNLSKVIVKRCERDYVRKHYHRLVGNCRYGDLCIKMGEVREKERLKPWSYLYVMHKAGCRLKPGEGRQAVLGVVMDYIHNDSEDVTRVLDIFEVPHVRKMMLYLGMQSATGEIMALSRAAERLVKAGPDEWERIITEEWA